MKDKTHLLHKKQWIQWVLDFAEKDSNSLSPQARRNLSAEVNYFCSENFLEEDWDEYEQRQDLTEFTEEGKAVNITNIQEKAITLLNSMNLIHRPRREDRAIERILVLQELPDISSHIVSQRKGTFEIVRHPSSPSPENWLVLNFLSLIDKFENYPIHRCQGKNKDKECGHYFLNLSKREKLFCTPSCASRSVQAEKREELRRSGKWKTYLKKMRKYQKDRFDRKQREKAGPNVRVGRNKRRAKKED